METQTPSQLHRKNEKVSEHHKETQPLSFLEPILKEKLLDGNGKISEILKTLDEELNSQGLEPTTFYNLFSAAGDREKESIINKLLTLKQPDYKSKFEDIQAERKRIKNTVQEINVILDLVLENIRSKF